MSRSYKKFASQGVCTGSNTEYYRSRNRNTRRRNKHILKVSINKFDDLDEIDSVNLIKNNRNTHFDTWCEPTDGKWHAKTFREYLHNRCVRFLHRGNTEELQRYKEHFNKCKRK